MIPAVSLSWSLNTKRERKKPGNLRIPSRTPQSCRPFTAVAGVLVMWEANRHQYVPDLLDEPAFCHWGGPPAGKESAGVVLAKTDVGRHRHNRADGGARAADNDIDTFAELVAFGPASFSI
jgi:hypothetical protein